MRFYLMLPQPLPPFEGDLDSDVKQRLTAGLSRATKAVDSGAASALLKKWAALTSQISAS